MQSSMNRPLAAIPIFLLLSVVAGCGNRQEVVSGSKISPANSGLARQENDRAFALIRQGKYDEAEKALNRAIDADVMFGPARNNRGLVYYHQGRLYEAAHEFQYAIKLMPHQPEPRNNLGLVFEAAADHLGPAKLAEAVGAYEEARRMEPDNPEFIGNLARTKIKRGDRDDATQKLLEELVFKDTRPEWRDWARTNLLRIRARPVESSPTTLPTTR
jgi:Flp pilus assembly protein TadD